MVELWFAVLCLMITLFVIMAGWDIGAGALHFIVAKDQGERRELIAAIGPLWTWNEVWLVATGAVLLAAFPRVLAISFPAYYLALFPVLWTLLLRGLSLEFRGHIPSPMWRAFWDFVLVVANVLLAILFGAAIGNLIRGIPLKPDTPLSLPLFTDFGVRGMPGILDWYTSLMAIFTLACLCAHGASYLALKANGEVHRRVRVLARWLWLATVFLLLVVSLATSDVRPELFAGMAARPAAWIGLVLVGGGLAAIFTAWRSGAEQRMFLGGCVLIAGLLGTAAASLFPVILYSTVSPEYSITAYNGSSDANSLQAAIYWWPVAFALALAYFGFVGKYYRRRVHHSLDANDTQRPY
jgi:cytochrome d ubiquinol oxidase subunit II